MLYQTNSCRERTKHRVANQAKRRQGNKFNKCINKNKETNCSYNCVGEYKKVC